MKKLVKYEVGGLPGVNLEVTQGWKFSDFSLISDFFTSTGYYGRSRLSGKVIVLFQTFS